MVGNRLLEALPANELDEMMANLERVTLDAKAVLYEPDVPIEHLYFPVDAVGSIVSVLTAKR